MLNLKTKGLNNAVAVLGGYDAMVKAGLPVETGQPKFVPAPEPKKVQPAPAAPASQPAPAATQAKPARRHKAKTKH
ncbi:MAG TPA: hypothetical protein VGO91_11150 [Pyrinomonadaceae bacterium]|nr:hypothetical protein [Pyrinomonadaceae bacterium]